MAPKIALVCDWLTSRGGAERVIYALHKIFPQAPIYTSLYDENLSEFEDAEIIVSYLQNIPFAIKNHRFFLPLMPQIFESFDFKEFDIVISSSHSCAKGIIVKPDTLHICYCHSPMRYLWDNHHSYIQEYEMSSFLKKFSSPFLHNIRIWDKLASARPDYYIANSKYIKDKIKKFYRRDSEVIHPPIETERFKITDAPKTYYLAVGRLTPYKKFSLLVDVFNELDEKLVIVGEGVEYKKLKERAKKNIIFLRNVSEKELAGLYANAKALLFPQAEDFGITPLESMASGRPVIAYKAGGSLETIKEGVSGIFFDEQTPISLEAALYKFEKMHDEFNPQKIRKHAEKFSMENFTEKMRDFINKAYHFQILKPPRLGGGG